MIFCFLSCWVLSVLHVTTRVHGCVFFRFVRVLTGAIAAPYTNPVHLARERAFAPKQATYSTRTDVSLNNKSHARAFTCSIVVAGHCIVGGRPGLILAFAAYRRMGGDLLKVCTRHAVRGVEGAKGILCHWICLVKES